MEGTNPKDSESNGFSSSDTEEKVKPTIQPNIFLPPSMQQYSDFSVVYDNCLFRGASAAVIGAGLGIAFGAIFGLNTPTPEQLEKPLMTQVVEGFKQTGRASVSSAKNFALVGAVFSTTECSIEHLRAKSDIYNGLAAGCISGGVLSWRGGPQGMALGCVGFAAFSGAIDYFFGRHGDPSTKIEHDDKFS